MPIATVNVTVDGDCQSVRLPPEIHLDAEQVFVKKIGGAVMLYPKNSKASASSDPWKYFNEAIGNVTDDFMVERVQLPQAPRESAFE